MSAGHPSKNDSGVLRWRTRPISPPLIVFATIFILVWCAGILTIAVDPLDTLSWGEPSKLDHSDYTALGTPYLINLITKDSTIDTVLVGSSTSAYFSRGMMDRILPSTKNAFNISYNSARPADRALVMDLVSRSAHVKHVIVMLDWFYESAPTDLASGFPEYLYKNSVLQMARTVSPLTIRLSVEALEGRSLRLPSWNYAVQRNARTKGYMDFQTPGALHLLARVLAERRNTIDAPDRHSCEDFGAITQQLAPEARTLASRNVPLDVIIPPYSLAGYYMASTFLDIAFLNAQMALRRCAVKVLDGIKGVRVFSFDNESWLTGDLANYEDPTHLHDERLFEYMLRSTVLGSHRLTVANVDLELKRLHDRVLRYKVSDSRVVGYNHNGS